MKGISKYFDGEWSFAKFKIPDSHAVCAFTEEAQLVVVSTEGTYYVA